MTGREFHARTVKNYLNGSPCAIVPTEWPYDCVAKDKHPNDQVFTCTAHRVWWHEGDKR